MNLKTKHLILQTLILFVLCFFFLPFSFLFADTIIDSVYSDPLLDGEIIYTNGGNFHSLNTYLYSLYIGDTNMCNPPYPPANSVYRSYISFLLPEISGSLIIDSVFVRLYKYYSVGAMPVQNYPIWNITGGDTIKCILSHIDYGDELDEEDRYYLEPID